MFRELSRLREAEKLLRAGRAAEALEIVRDPALADHRRAVEARAEARRKLAEETRAALAAGRMSEAAGHLESLRRDAHDEAVKELEAAFRAARREAHAGAAAREAALREARRAARSGDRARARALVSGVEGDEARSFLAELEASEKREAAWTADVEAAVAGGDSSAVERALDATESAHADPARLKDLFERAARSALKRRDADGFARLWARLRERGLAPTHLAADGAAVALEAARRRLTDADLAAAAAALAPFPLGCPADDEALGLRVGLWAWQRGREAFRRGQDAVGAVLYDEADAKLPRSPARAQERKDAARASEALREAVFAARRLCTAGRLKAAHAGLVAALGDAPADHMARELAAALELDLRRDEEAMAEAQEALSRLDLRTARRIAAGLSLRRSDLGEAELLLNEIEARSERALRDSIDAERRLVVAPPSAKAARSAGRPIPAGEPFLLRVENEGDWLVEPRDSVTLGSAAKKQADLRILAAVGARHARLSRERSADGGATYRIVAESGLPVSVNDRDATEAVLKDGDVVRLGRAVTFVFSRPFADRRSAALRLLDDHTILGCARILLFSEEGRAGGLVVAGPGEDAHATLRGSDERFELFRADDAESAGRLLIRSARGVSVDGGGERAQVAGHAGVVYSVGATRFYLDPAPERA